MFDLSPVQILIVLVIALLVFGPKKLPEMGRSIGRGIREFKGAMLDDEPPRPSAPAPREDRHPAGPATERVPAATATAATAAAAPPPHEDDVLEGVIVPGDAPPQPGESPRS